MVLREALSEYREAVKQSSSEEIEDRVKDLVEKANQLEKKLGFFSIPP